MALVDELLKGIQDKALRAALAKEIDTLRKRKTFGLVFEKHLPEIAVVTGAPIRAGTIVRRRDHPAKDDEFLVESVKGRSAKIRPVRGGEVEDAPLELLASVKQFGEPTFPGLRSIGEFARSSDRPYHTVIDGENFHVLELLGIFGQDSVDCIYIDPPYTTRGLATGPITIVSWTPMIDIATLSGSR